MCNGYEGNYLIIIMFWFDQWEKENNNIIIIAEHLSVRKLFHISLSCCICTYMSVTLRNVNLHYTAHASTSYAIPTKYNY